jgi:hypothetical protein
MFKEVISESMAIVEDNFEKSMDSSSLRQSRRLLVTEFLEIPATDSHATST